MKVADGITDSLRATALAKVQLVTGWYESNTQGIIEEACMQWAMAEERERVLREALRTVEFIKLPEWQHACCPICLRRPHKQGCVIDAALATPAPEPAQKEHA